MLKYHSEKGGRWFVLSATTNGCRASRRTLRYPINCFSPLHQFPVACPLFILLSIAKKERERERERERDNRNAPSFTWLITLSLYEHISHQLATRCFTRLFTASLEGKNAFQEVNTCAYQSSQIIFNLFSSRCNQHLLRRKHFHCAPHAYIVNAQQCLLARSFRDGIHTRWSICPSIKSTNQRKISAKSGEWHPSFAVCRETIIRMEWVLRDHMFRVVIRMIRWLKFSLIERVRNKRTRGEKIAKRNARHRRPGIQFARESDPLKSRHPVQWSLRKCEQKSEKEWRKHAYWSAIILEQLFSLSIYLTFMNEVTFDGRVQRRSEVKCTR